MSLKGTIDSIVAISALLMLSLTTTVAAQNQDAATVDRISNALVNGSIKGDLQSVKALIANGADVNCRVRVATLQKGGNEITPLIAATINGHINVVRLLLMNGANPNLTDLKGSTALMMARKEDHEIFKSLLLAGTDVNHKNLEGITPLMFAAMRGDLAAMRLLLRAGAIPHETDNSGYSVLSWAITSDHDSSEIIQILLENKVDVNIKDNEGYTPLMIAAAKSSSDIISLLLKAGANPTIKNAGGDTALSIAIGEGRADIVKLLQKPGSPIHPPTDNQDNNTQRGNIPATISGMIRLGSSNLFIDNAIIVIKGINNNFFKKFKVHKSGGKFSISNIPPGEYELSLDESMRYELKESKILIINLTSGQKLEMDLIATPKPYVPDNTPDRPNPLKSILNRVRIGM